MKPRRFHRPIQNRIFSTYRRRRDTSIGIHSSVSFNRPSSIYLAFQRALFHPAIASTIPPSMDTPPSPQETRIRGANTQHNFLYDYVLCAFSHLSPLSHLKTLSVTHSLSPTHTISLLPTCCVLSHPPSSCFPTHHLILLSCGWTLSGLIDPFPPAGIGSVRIYGALGLGPCWSSLPSQAQSYPKCCQSSCLSFLK